MIPESNITQWRATAPWPNDAQVEQDLVISRALVEIFNNNFLKDQVAFRGGTALHKLYLKDNSRYSEDIDLVLTKDQPYGPIIDALRDSISPWLGKPSRDTGKGKITLRFNFETEIPPIQKMKLKIEINTLEHYSFLGFKPLAFKVENSWFTGDTEVITFEPEELLGTKLRALFQRKKGRDLFDMETAHKSLMLDSAKVVDCFKKYTHKQNLNITRAQYEENLEEKKTSKKFLHDIAPLLRPGHSYTMETGFEFVAKEYMPHLSGAPWKKP